MNEESGSKKSPGLSGGRCAVQEAVGKEGSATAGGIHTQNAGPRPPRRLILPQRARRYLKGGGGGKYGEGCLPAPAFTGVNGAEGWTPGSEGAEVWESGLLGLREERFRD